jgi:uncharacterized iron-regulated membrane protein
MSKKSRSRTWFLVHSWLALPIWFFVLIVCVTGTLAVVSQEIVWLALPEIRASQPSDDAPLLTFGQAVEAIRTARPELVIREISRPDESHFALTALVSNPDGSSATLFVNPYTGVIQGKNPDFDFQQFTRALHGWWLVPFTSGFSWGWYLVSLLSLPLLASLVTGLVVFKRFWRAFLKPTLRLNQGARVFWGDFHRLSGIWSIWFIAVIAITGLWFLIQAILFDNHIDITTEGVPDMVARQEVPRTADGLRPNLVPVDNAINTAQSHIPGLEISTVTFPGTAYNHIALSGRGWYPLMFQSASINPYNGQIAEQRLLSDYSKLEFVTQSMRPLHTGDFGGLWIKMIWMFFGLLLSMMVLSGLLIWTKRTAIATAAALRRPARSREASASEVSR